MYVIGISGSPRGEASSTRRLVERVLDGAQSAGADAELVDITRVRVAYCVACDSCHATGKCSRDDEFGQVKEKLLSAQGIVLGSPLYFNSVTAQLKTVIDRLADVIHCQLFLGKYACSVCAAGGTEYDLGLSYMNGVLTRLGCNVVGGVGASRAVPGLYEKAEEEAFELGRALVQAIREGRTYEDQEAVHAEMRERFMRLIAANRDHWPYEYEYWRSKGWLS
ncbi:MAG: flavodoxin family protein [Armatimonadota bacterium]|nr:flavodoxin family protein [Armatimonadota bacterium]